MKAFSFSFLFLYSFLQFLYAHNFLTTMWNDKKILKIHGRKSTIFSINMHFALLTRATKNSVKQKKKRWKNIKNANEQQRIPLLFSVFYSSSWWHIVFSWKAFNVQMFLFYFIFKFKGLMERFFEKGWVLLSSLLFENVNFEISCILLFWKFY